MRDSPAAALGLILGLMIIGPVVSYCVFWAILHYTNTGLLVYKEEISVSASSQDTDGREDEIGLRCLYFTGTRLLEHDISPEQLAADEGGSPDSARCPWRIEVS